MNLNQSSEQEKALIDSIPPHSVLYSTDKGSISYGGWEFVESTSSNNSLPVLLKTLKHLTKDTLDDADKLKQHLKKKCLIDSSVLQQAQVVYDDIIFEITKVLKKIQTILNKDKNAQYELEVYAGIIDNFQGLFPTFIKFKNLNEAEKVEKVPIYLAINIVCRAYKNYSIKRKFIQSTKTFESVTAEYFKKYLICYVENLIDRMSPSTVQELQKKAIIFGFLNTFLFTSTDNIHRIGLATLINININEIEDNKVIVEEILKYLVRTSAKDVSFVSSGLIYDSSSTISLILNYITKLIGKKDGKITKLQIHIIECLFLLLSFSSVSNFFKYSFSDFAKLFPLMTNHPEKEWLMLNSLLLLEHLLIDGSANYNSMQRLSKCFAKNRNFKKIITLWKDDLQDSIHSTIEEESTQFGMKTIRFTSIIAGFIINLDNVDHLDEILKIIDIFREDDYMIVNLLVEIHKYLKLKFDNDIDKFIVTHDFLRNSSLDRKVLSTILGSTDIKIKRMEIKNNIGDYYRNHFYLLHDYVNYEPIDGNIKLYSFFVKINSILYWLAKEDIEFNDIIKNDIDDLTTPIIIYSKFLMINAKVRKQSRCKKDNGFGYLSKNHHHEKTSITTAFNDLNHFYREKTENSTNNNNGLNKNLEKNLEKNLVENNSSEVEIEDEADSATIDDYQNSWIPRHHRDPFTIFYDEESDNFNEYHHYSDDDTNYIGNNRETIENCYNHQVVDNKGKTKLEPSSFPERLLNLIGKTDLIEPNNSVNWCI